MRPSSAPTGHEIQERSQGEKNLGADPLDGAEFDVVRILREVDVEYGQFLSMTQISREPCRFSAWQMPTASM